jgi:DNA polymerase-3 subunit delta'
MLFKDIIGQAEIKKRLIQSVKENRVSHAQLFLGMPGSGDLALALAYAQFISCENRQEDDSCNTCLSCIKYNKLVHPDLHFVFPTNTTKKEGEGKKESSKSKRLEFIEEWRHSLLNNPYLELHNWFEDIEIENKQAIINVEESTEIIKIVSLKSYESEYKVVIIWMAERMNAAAANKILKVLEEPPPKTLFLMVARNQEQMLPTIISRTQLLKIPRLHDHEIILALKERLSADEEDATVITPLAEGNWNEASRIMLNEEAAREQTEEYLQWMRNCFAFEKKIGELLNMGDDFADKKREKQKMFLQFGLHITRECLMLNLGGNSLVRLNENDKTSFGKFSQFIHPSNCSFIADVISEASYHVERNANPRILFLDLSCKIGNLLRMKQAELA